jgi:hypothetical protein
LTMEQLPGTNAIIYPQEIWNGFNHREAKHELSPVQSSKLVTDPPQ